MVLADFTSIVPRLEYSGGRRQPPRPAGQHPRVGGRPHRPGGARREVRQAPLRAARGADAAAAGARGERCVREAALPVGGVGGGGCAEAEHQARGEAAGCEAERRRQESSPGSRLTGPSSRACLRARRYGQVVQMTWDGKVVRTLHDPTGRTPMISEAHESEDGCEANACGATADSYGRSHQQQGRNVRLITWIRTGTYTWARPRTSLWRVWQRKCSSPPTTQRGERRRRRRNCERGRRQPRCASSCQQR